MAIELNVGLNVTGGDNQARAVRQRDLIARSVLGQVAPAKFVRHVSQYEQVNGTTITEQTLVARLPGAKLDNALRAKVHDLAARTGQDCIAVFDSVNGHGELIGPRAAAWPAFAPEYFTTYAAATTPLPVAA